MNHTIPQHHALRGAMRDWKHMPRPIPGADPERDQGPGILGVLAAILVALVILGAVLSIAHSAWHALMPPGADLDPAVKFVAVPCPEDASGVQYVNVIVSHAGSTPTHVCIRIQRSTWAPRPTISASAPVVRVERY